MTNRKQSNKSYVDHKRTLNFREETMSIVVVVCGDRWKETLVLLKSALLFTKGHLQFYIFTDLELVNVFQRELNIWKKDFKKNFDYKILEVKFPSGEFESSWRKLFKPCSSQRLFLPVNVDSVLYLDTDTLILGPVEQIWAHFKLMNSSQFAALAPEHEDPLTGWYNRFARHPFYKPLGVNTGVMLMNLTRMRKFEWERYLLPIYKQYKLKIPWGDQDIINIIFHFHPDKLYIYSCKYNYRADHCMYTSVCKTAEKEGIVVLHGSRGIFHSDKFPPFQSVYKAIEQYKWGGDLFRDFFLTLELYLNSSRVSNCGKDIRPFILNVQKSVKQNNMIS
ncbi:conserved hypothetical protein [Pediculus humanus corporis]|uniref:UDP-D-xylose:beta-D-glucoside alpha-1,3-D-xylosyltransferase n=1 Tax=Pediculus humanus subsp. corporis TaxID=121224 RepID=E0VDT7_PEDHC|nr:uncharacterized protein Phum_PHUM125140 [Pediculus humanus corporis]EEB11543.1 conserved hypothetical protein [Pediculus humanus corporis]